MASDAPRATTSEEINRLLLGHAKPGAKIEIEDVRGHAAVAAGIQVRAELSIDGEAGDFLGAFNAGAVLRTRGDVANYAGYGMLAGAIVVLGSAGEAVGAHLRGGELLVFGDAQGAAGWRQAGGLVAVKGDAGARIGAGMSGGELAVLGSAEGPVGEGMTGGAVYVRQSTPIDPGSARAAPLDVISTVRLREIAARMRVTDLKPVDFVKVTAAGAAAPKPVPPAPSRGEDRPVAKVRVAEAPAAPSPRVSVLSPGEEPKGAPPP
jgi:glutamate synthase domain-containing protein 3